MTAGTTLDPLDVASGLVFGRVRDAPPRFGSSPRAALEEVVRESLLRPPCLVSFSGGRDSSAVLAVAAAVARRESLPLPVPVTARFAAVPASREDEWQELVVGHLRLPDWIRLDFADELDCVGPYARRALLRHGLLWPFNAHFHLPLLEAAAGGALLTGVGGDELLGESRWARPLDLLRGSARPTRGDARRLVFFAAPAWLRARWLTRRLPARYEWLTPDARREVAARWAKQVASEPRLPRRHASWRGSFRYQRVGVRSLSLLAADAAVHAAHPFLDDRFRAAVARTAPLLRFRTRTEALLALVGDLLPEEVLARSTKSSFDGAFFAGPARAFAETWTGRGFAPELVDAERLRAEWVGHDAPDPRSFLALQAAWLADVSARQPRHEPLRDLRERLPVAGAAELQAG